MACISCIVHSSIWSLYRLPKSIHFRNAFMQAFMRHSKILKQGLEQRTSCNKKVYVYKTTTAYDQRHCRCSLLCSRCSIIGKEDTILNFHAEMHSYGGCIKKKDTSLQLSSHTVNQLHGRKLRDETSQKFNRVLKIC